MKASASHTGNGREVGATKVSGIESEYSKAVNLQGRYVFWASMYKSDRPSKHYTQGYMRLRSCPYINMPFCRSRLDNIVVVATVGYTNRVHLPAELQQEQELAVFPDFILRYKLNPGRGRLYTSTRRSRSVHQKVAKDPEQDSTGEW
jgi:hypothetical protein